jgi:hypothetical protein
LRSGNFRRGQRTLQLGSPSGGVNFFNAICRLLMYEGSFSTRFSDLPISADSLVCAEFVSAGVGLTSVSSVSIDPLQLINVEVSSIAIILNSRQVGCTRSEKTFKIATDGNFGNRIVLPVWQCCLSGHSEPRKMNCGIGRGCFSRIDARTQRSKAQKRDREHSFERVGRTGAHKRHNKVRRGD